MVSHELFIFNMFIRTNVDYYVIVFQVEDEDVSLVPEQSNQGFQFDPNAEIPSDGFKF